MTDEQKKYFVGFKNVYSMNELTALGEIEDPYGGDEKTYEKTAEKLKISCEKILELLKK